MTFRDRIHPQLRDWYDASAGFDFDHLETFVPKCNEAELANLKEDPQGSFFPEKTAVEWLPPPPFLAQ